MRIRLEGTLEECDCVAAAIAKVLTIQEVSRPYANRPPSSLVRVYLTAALTRPEEK